MIQTVIPIPAGGFTVGARYRWVWNPARGLWDKLPIRAYRRGAPRTGGGAPVRLGATGDQSWCETASAFNPLSYLLCLPSDIKRVYAAATNTFPTPPGAAPPGAPCANVDDPGCQAELTVPGAFTPAMAADQGRAASLDRWNKFFATVNPDSPGGPAAPCTEWFSFLDSTCNSLWWIPLAALAVFAFLSVKGGRR